MAHNNAQNTDGESPTGSVIARRLLNSWRWTTTVMAFAAMAVAVLTWSCRLIHLGLAWIDQNTPPCHAAHENSWWFHFALICVVSLCEAKSLARIWTQLASAGRSFLRSGRAAGHLFVFVIRIVYLMLGWGALLHLGCQDEWLAQLLFQPMVGILLLAIVTLLEALELAHLTRRSVHRSMRLALGLARLAARSLYRPDRREPLSVG